MQDIQNKSNISRMFNIQEKENGEIAISGRELHQALEVGTRYDKWFDRMIEYGFENGVDYVSQVEKVHGQKRARTYEQINHIMTLDTAKEIAMIQRSEPGKRARQYFIQVEKAWNSPEMIMQRALKIANSTINQLETQIEKDKPKVMFADAVDTSTSSILVGELAKLISQNGVKIGQNRLFQWLRETDKFSLSSGEWQFETGVLSVDDVKYKHNTTGFKIYNDSTDTIDPHIRHKFRLLINIDAPKGFTLTNNTTGDVFKYNKAIKKKQTLILNGVHPTIDNKRVGSNTNWQWITLAPGFNEIEITGENISNPTTQWVFPFIYR